MLLLIFYKLTVFDELCNTNCNLVVISFDASRNAAHRVCTYLLCSVLWFVNSSLDHPLTCVVINFVLAHHQVWAPVELLQFFIVMYLLEANCSVACFFLLYDYLMRDSRLMLEFITFQVSFEEFYLSLYLPQATLQL